MSVHYTKRQERRVWQSRANQSRKSRPEVHATQNLGDILQAKCPKYVNQAKKSEVEMARSRFLELENLLNNTFRYLRSRGTFIPWDMTQRAYPAIRKLAGTVDMGMFNMNSYRSAKTCLEWACNSWNDYQDMLKTFGLRK